MAAMKRWAPAVALLLLSGCLATQQDMVGLSQQGDSMSLKMNQLKKIVASMQANQADLNEKLDQMHADVTGLSENLEDNYKQMSKLSGKLDDVQAVIGNQVSSLDKEIGANRELLKAAEIRRRREAEERRVREEARRKNEAERKAAQEKVKQQKAARLKKEAQAAAAEAKKKKKKSGKKKGVADGPKPSELFHSARIQLGKKQYEGAEQGFTLYLEKYSKGENADLALYYLAQTHYARDEWKKAARQYAKVLDQHPDSEITASARLRYALCLMGMKKHLEEAKQYLQSIPEDFPRTPEAKKAKELLKSWKSPKKG
jgi:tol-pal system protein YbgF